jgi:hypothetical protein
LTRIDLPQPAGGHDGFYQQKRLSRVDTPHGHVKCEKVVNCAGPWGREVGRLAGVSVPLYAREHFYLLTQTVEGLTRQEPMLSDHDGHLYIREEVGGLFSSRTRNRCRSRICRSLRSPCCLDRLLARMDNAPMQVLLMPSRPLVGIARLYNVNAVLPRPLTLAPSLLRLKLFNEVASGDLRWEAE